VAAERGLDIKVVEFTDYVIPNQALALGDLEANSLQHESYLKYQMSKTGWKIVKVATTIASPQGVYEIQETGRSAEPRYTFASRLDDCDIVRSNDASVHRCFYFWSIATARACAKIIDDANYGQVHRYETLRYFSLRFRLTHLR
jgi:hypothetical protein